MLRLVNLVSDIHAVGDRLFMAIFAYDVLSEKTVGPIIGRRRQADQIGIEILNYLAPQIVDRAVALIDDDEIEKLRRIFSL